MLKHFIFLSVFTLATTSCVSSKLYKALESKYSNLKSDYDELSVNNDQEILQKKELEQQLATLQASDDEVQSERDRLTQEVAALQKNTTIWTRLIQHLNKTVQNQLKKMHKKTESFWHNSKPKNKHLLRRMTA